MAALRELAATCAYATMEDEMLRDQLIEKAYAPAVRERLLMETSLTLDSAITLACQVEQALQSSSVLMLLLCRRSHRRSRATGGTTDAALTLLQTDHHRGRSRSSGPATDVEQPTWLMQPTAQLPKLNATVKVRLATSQKFAAQLNK